MLEEKLTGSLHLHPTQAGPKPGSELEAISWVLGPWDLGLTTIVLTEISKSWYPFPYMSVN